MLSAKLRCKSVYFGLLLFFLSLFNAYNIHAANVTLSWIPPTTRADGTPLTDLTGYKIYFGVSSKNYTQNIDVGNVTSYTVANLSTGTAYYFATTAYDASSNESSFSNEISKTIAVVTYYCDKDNDGYISTSVDGTCAGTGCEPAGCKTTIGNDCNDNNVNIKPNASDTSCNGIDDNCNGQVDEGYVTIATTCGVGACSAAGQLTCQSGKAVNTCSPGTPAANDNTCNGIDDNCNGQVDEGYVAAATTCGVGACSAAGQLTCQSGKAVNTCSPGTPAANDNTCNGIDDNCNGQVDEGFVSATTTCGVGSCASTGVQQCTNGQLIDTCTLYTSTAELCDGLDNNCNGQIDEGCAPVIMVSKILLGEDFANGIPNTWLVNGKWGTANSCGKNIGSPLISPYAIVDSSCTATGIDELITPSFDTGSCNYAQLAYSNNYHHNSGNAEVDVSNDAGATWMSSLYMAADDGYPAGNWKDMDISNIAGTKDAKIKFKYADNTGDGYWALDNVWVTCQPTQLEFSSQDQMPSPVQTIMITNTGSVGLSINAIGIGGADPSDFIIDSGNDTCSNKTLLPSESCTLDVVFLPLSAGAKSANLSIPSNDPNMPVWAVPLAGTGTVIVNPKSTIKANGLTGSVNVKRGKNVTVTFELDPGSYVNKNADWWVLEEYRTSRYYYSAATHKWSTGSSFYYQGPLVKQGPVTVFSSSSLSKGQYKFYFGVDTNMNGVRDSGEYYYNVVTVNVR